MNLRVACIMALAGLSATDLSAATAASPVQEQPKFRLVVPDKIHFSGDFKFDLYFVGTAGDVIIYPFMAPGRDVIFEVYRKGKKVAASEPLRSPPPGPVVSDISKFWHLGKWNIRGGSFFVSSKEVFPGPGRYTVLAVYRSTMPSIMIDDSHFLSTESGELKSQPIDLDIM